jgi:uncharacterized protein YndB with AHSA1/START domain
MAHYNWLQFTKRITVKADKQKIYKAWSTQNGLESFFLREALFRSPEKKYRAKNEIVEPGDSYEWRWHGYPDSMTEYGKVFETNGNGYLEFSFTNGCIVAITIKEEKGETICELVQNMMPADEGSRQMLYIECSTGWTFYLANLKSILEGGIDLRNKNEAIQHVINS